MAQSSAAILMYHKVGAPVRGHADRFLNVSASSFARQMRLLARLGYRCIRLDEAARGLVGEAPLPPRAVCVTFDDGYACVAEHAAPVLRALGWPGVVFAATDHVGACNGWDETTGWPLLPLMTWEALASLHAEGWEVAGHTRSHARLSELPDEEVAAQVGGGADAIREHVGAAPRTFCYPFGDLDERTPAIVRQCGFAAACTTRSGIARPDTDPMLLPRVKVSYRDGVAGLMYRMLIRPRLG